MNYAGIIYADTANGTGIRTSLFVSGCTHHCKGCFNPESWDFAYGKRYDAETEKKILDSMRSAYVEGLTILGGEPMEAANQVEILPLVRKVKAMKKNIWIYTGYTWEELIDPNNARCHGSVTEEILRNIDVLVDGEFHESERDYSLAFRGSRNQRIICVPKMLAGNGSACWKAE